MKISILCSDEDHPINSYLNNWISEYEKNNVVELIRKKKELNGGDILFLVSCSEIIDKAVRDKYSASLVLHASDLPLGRGWSPFIWELLAGKEELVVSLLEAEDKVDSGRIWKKVRFHVPKHALWDEVNHLLFEAECGLMSFAVENFDNIQPFDQDLKIEPTYYPKRSPSDSKIDPNVSLIEQFNKIRLCDPNRFPSFFEIDGKKFKVRIEKFED